MTLFTDFCGFSGSSGPSQSTRSTSDPEPLTGSEFSCSDLLLASFSSLSPTVEFTDESFKFESSLAETEARVSDISWGQVSKSQVELTFKTVSKAQTYPMSDTKFMTKLVVKMGSVTVLVARYSRYFYSALGFLGLHHRLPTAPHPRPQRIPPNLQINIPRTQEAHHRPPPLSRPLPLSRVRPSCPK